MVFAFILLVLVLLYVQLMLGFVSWLAWRRLRRASPDEVQVRRARRYFILFFALFIVMGMVTLRLIDLFAGLVKGTA